MNKKAFTLIELLVVIAIIALLLAILMPSLQSAKKIAQAVICRSNLKQWGLIYSLYASDNNGSLPQGTGISLGGTTISDSDAYWPGATMPYYESPKIRFCPSSKPDRDPANDPLTFSIPEDLGGTFEDWGPLPGAAGIPGWWDEYPSGSYGENGWAVNPQKSLAFIWTPILLASYTWRTTLAKGTSNIPLFLDCVYVSANPFSTNTPPANSGDFSFASATNDMQRICLDRHKGAINVVFLDMSARKIGLKELWTLKWHRDYNTGNDWTRPDAPWPDWMRNFK